MMSGQAELPERPEPRGVAGWLRFGAVVAGGLLVFLPVLYLGPSLDALGSTWGMPHRIHLGACVGWGTWSLWLAAMVREWTRPARRFLSAHGLPRSDG